MNPTSNILFDIWPLSEQVASGKKKQNKNKSQYETVTLFMYKCFYYIFYLGLGSCIPQSMLNAPGGGMRTKAFIFISSTIHIYRINVMICTAGLRNATTPGI